MTRLQRLSLASLVVGLVLASFIVPWSLKTIGQTTKMLAQQQEMLKAEAAADDARAQEARAAAVQEQQREQERAAQQAAAAEQAARIKAEMEKTAIPPKTKAAPTPEPSAPAYSIVPRGTKD